MGAATTLGALAIGMGAEVAAPGEQAASQGDQTDECDGEHEQTHGVVASVNTAGSSFTLTLKVTTQTRFEGVTKTFTGLKMGMQAEVGGTPESKGVILASTVNTGTSDQHEGSGDSNTSAADIAGVVVTVGAASFTVKGDQGTVTITVSTTTTFAGVKGLADLKAGVRGVRVEVKGTKQSTGSLAAQQVTVGNSGHSGD